MIRFMPWHSATFLVCTLSVLGIRNARAEVVYSNLINDLDGSLSLSANQIFWDDVNPIRDGRLSEVETLAEYDVIGPKPNRFTGTMYFRYFGNPDSGQFGPLIASL